MPTHTKRPVNLYIECRINLYIECRINRDEEYGCGMYRGNGFIHGAFGSIEFEIADVGGEYDGNPSFAEPELDLDGDSEWPRYLKPLTDYYNMEITDYGWNGWPRSLSYKFKYSDEIITPKVKDDDDEEGPETPWTLIGLIETLGFDVTVEENLSCEDDFHDDWDE